jgi:serine/threonine protein kinase
MIDKERLLATAMEIPAGPDRTAFVEQATADNRELREEIFRLLQIHDDAGSFLELSAWDRDSTLRSLDSPEEPVLGLDHVLGLLEPDGSGENLGRLGPFKIVELLGEGGSAFVFRAIDSRLNREVAIKLLRPGLMLTPRHQKKFLEEAQTLASLRADHIINIYEVGEYQNLPYFVMEYLPEGSLQTRLSQKGPLPLDVALKIGEQVLEGLKAAHSKGILHRDIKPSNVLIERFPDRVKLSDFGLARSVLLEDEDRAIGTPQFSSPEQIKGEAVNQQTDFFGFGCLLYSMLVGQSPFAGTSRVQTIQLTIESNPEPLSHFGLSIPEALQNLLDRLLAKLPAGRPSDVDEVLASIRSVQRELGEPPTSRRGWLWTAGGGLAAAGLLYLTSRSWRTPKPRQVLPANAVSELKLYDGNLNAFLHSQQNATLVTSEPLALIRPIVYWRPTDPEKLATVTYQLEFSQPLRSCRIQCTGYCAFSFDESATFKLWAGPEENSLKLAISISQPRMEYWPRPGKSISVPQFTIDDPQSYHGPRAWIDVSHLVEGRTTLFLKAEMYSSKEIFTWAGVSLGPAGSQFLRSDVNRGESPLIVEAQV